MQAQQAKLYHNNKKGRESCILCFVCSSSLLSLSKIAAVQFQYAFQLTEGISTTKKASISATHTPTNTHICVYEPEPCEKWTCASILTVQCTCNYFWSASKYVKWQSDCWKDSMTWNITYLIYILMETLGAQLWRGKLALNVTERQSKQNTKSVPLFSGSLK